MQTSRLHLLISAMLTAGPVHAGLVWRADFNVDGNTNGVAVITNGPGKNQIAGPAAGFLTITNWDNTESAYVPDKAGRALGGVKSSSDSFSGLYKFSWSTLNGLPTEAYEFAGFLGEAVPQTRQVLGALLRHWRADGVSYVALDVAAGSVGNTSFGYRAGLIVSLGSNPASNTYQLAMGYNGSTHVLTLGLYSAAGTMLASVSADFDTDLPGFHVPGPPSSEYNALALTWLGWGDYTGNGGNIASVWKVDELSYFDTATGAFDNLEGVVVQKGACCQSSGTCLDGQSQASCAESRGIWQGSGTTCDSSSCLQPVTGACCAVDGTCSLTIAADCAGAYKGDHVTCAEAACTAFDPGAEPWDVHYTGVDSAADNVANQLRWDSAIDDDWNQPNSTFRLNTPSVGFMSVDRATNPADHGKTGNIWIRDPSLSFAAGVTMELRVQIKPNSNTDAFSITYLDDGTSFGVHLSPNRIKAGNLAAAGTGNTIPFDTTDALHLYRIVRPGGSHSIRVHVDNSPTPILTGSGDTTHLVGSTPYLLYPRVLIGDNENNTIYNANYILDFARYRRGAAGPGQPPPPLPARTLPAFPPAAPAAESWANGYDGVGIPSGNWIMGGGGAWTQQADGIMELNTIGSPANARLDNVSGWPNRGAVTIEARIRVLPDNQPGGFNLVANDQVGDTALVLSTDKAALMHAFMPVGMSAVPMNTTDRFHVYRMTRDADGLYWQLYIDNRRFASVAHQHSAGNQLSFSRVGFGDFAFPVAANGCHVLIDYIRWHQGTNAPHDPCHAPFPDHDGDGDVDQEDFGVFQTCLTEGLSGILPGCSCFDYDYSDAIDGVDFDAFAACMSGSGVPAKPTCPP